MPFVEWDDRYLLKIDIIDQHHQHLFELLNKTYEDFRCNSSANNLGPVLHELLDYATYHFITEEKYMATHLYPGIADHKEEHRSFVIKISKLHKAFLKGDLNLTFETIVYLRNWITQHILNTDAQFGIFLTQKKQ